MCQQARWETENKAGRISGTVALINVCHSLGCCPQGPGQETWASANFMKLSETKYKVLYLGQVNPQHKYRLGGEQIESSPEAKDFGMLSDEYHRMV